MFLTWIINYYEKSWIFFPLIVLAYTAIEYEKASGLEAILPMVTWKAAALPIFFF